MAECRLLVMLLYLEQSLPVLFGFTNFRTFAKKLDVTDIFVNKAIKVCTSLTTSKLLKAQLGNLMGHLGFVYNILYFINLAFFFY